MMNMYNIFYDQAPSYLCQFKKKVDSVHSYETRVSIKPDVVPKINTQGQSTLCTMGQSCGIVWMFV